MECVHLKISYYHKILHKHLNHTSGKKMKSGILIISCTNIPVTLQILISPLIFYSDFFSNNTKIFMKIDFSLLSRLLKSITIFLPHLRLKIKYQIQILTNVRFFVYIKFNTLRFVFSYFFFSKSSNFFLVSIYKHINTYGIFISNLDIHKLHHRGY